MSVLYTKSSNAVFEAMDSRDPRFAQLGLKTARIYLKNHGLSFGKLALSSPALTPRLAGLLHQLDRTGDDSHLAEAMIALSILKDQRFSFSGLYKTHRIRERAQDAERRTRELEAELRDLRDKEATLKAEMTRAEEARHFEKVEDQQDLLAAQERRVKLEQLSMQYAINEARLEKIRNQEALEKQREPEPQEKEAPDEVSLVPAGLLTFGAAALYDLARQTFFRPRKKPLVEATL